jgi:hypothetical protein
VSRIKHFLKVYDQIFIPDNHYLPWGEFGNLFEELFKPSPALQESLDRHLAEIQARGGGGYVSATFRFQELLGDFKENEDGCITLSKAEQENLIQNCLSHLKEIHEENPDKAILVTSDSISFLNRAKILPYVYVFAAKITHLGVQSAGTGDAYKKSYVDFFMLAQAEKVYCVVDGPMYNSGFPRTAAMLHRTAYTLKVYYRTPIEFQE